jgi:hypothetical protein
MPSVVDVCNRALDKLGHGAITSLSDGAKAANLCDRAWPIVRNQVLRDHPWNFAVKRTTTAPSSTDPSWGFDYQHPLPADFLRLLEVRDLSTGEYQVENGNILTDEDVLYIRYIREVTDPNEYDALFVDAVAARLAYELAEALTQSNTKRDAAWQEYQDGLLRAKRADAQENPSSTFVEDDWVSVRY